MKKLLETWRRCNEYETEIYRERRNREIMISIMMMMTINRFRKNCGLLDIRYFGNILVLICVLVCR